ncbi:MAG: FAD-dependent monooxygenase [Rhodospirillaceae bacterium]
MSGLRILIAGAGLGGLAAASNLIRAGHDVTVFEQAPVLGEIGAGIQLSANAMHVLRHIGVAGEIEAVGVRPGAYVFRLYDTGEEISRFSLDEEHERLNGAPYVQVHRADLHEILARRALELKPDLVRLNHRAVGCEESPTGATLHFADGTSATGDLLIGADGVKSVVRRKVAGDVPATYTGDGAWRLTIPSDRLPKDFMGRVMSVWMGPGAHAVCYYLRNGKIFNFVGCMEKTEVSEESWTNKLPWEMLRADFEGWHEDIQLVVNTVEKDSCYLWSLFTRPSIPNWSLRRTTLLGDSAHPTLPYLAQGAAMAIEDGAVLTRALAQEQDVSAALDLYQRNRVDRTSKIVRQSTANRGLFHIRDREVMREAFAKRDEGADRNRWLYSYNALTVPLA